MTNASSTAGQFAEGVQGAALLPGGHSDVSYHLEVTGVDGTWAPLSVDFQETLNQTYELSVHAKVTGASPEVEELLGKDCSLTFERPTKQRAIKGMIRRARLNEHHDGLHVHLTVGPVLWALGENRDSRIYQDKTVPEIIEELHQRRLGGRSRELRNDLTRTYPRYEYVTQYQESDLAFVTRLCEQEGFFFFFDHDDGDHETLVLADAVNGLADVHDESVPFWHQPGQVPGGEVVVAAHHGRRLGATDVVVAEFVRDD